MDKHRPRPLAHFELAPALAVEPSAIVRDGSDAVGALILSLAMVFNDLKGLVIASSFLREARERARSEEEKGQVSGMVLQNARWAMGLTRELLALLEQRLEVIDSEEFQAVVASMPEASRSVWATLVSVARGDAGGDRELRAALAGAREGVAFSYGASGEQLARGFETAFPTASSRPDLAVGRPAFSDGKDLEGSRFYFADAAVKAATTPLASASFAEISGRTSAIGAMAHLAIKPLVIAHITRRAERIEPFVRPAATAGPTNS